MYQGQDFGFVGGSYEAPLPLQDAQRLINWYVEIDPSDDAKEPLALLGCPGLNPVLNTITGPVRGSYVLPGGTQALIVVSANVYLVTITAAATIATIPTYAATLVGTLRTTIGPVIMRDNGKLQNGLGGYCVIVDGVYGYYYLLQGTPYAPTFTGSVTAGSNTLVLPGSLPNGLIVSDGGVLSATSGALPADTHIIYVDTNGLTITMDQAATASTAGTPLIFTADFAIGDLSGTLTTPFAGTSGTDTILFSNAQLVIGTFTNGSTAVTWTTPLTGAAIATAQLQSDSAVEPFTLTIPTFGQITDSGFLGADHIAFIEGFLVFNQPASRTFFCTGPGPYSMLFPGLFFALKDSSTDNLITLYEDNRELWLIGERTSEVWYNAGGANFPFQRIPGVGPQIGCSSNYSITRAGGQLVWLAANEQGQNVVICTNQYTWMRISTHAVEFAISQYPVVSDAIGYAYEEEGHLFYMLIFPTADKTWCYDFTSKFWHERLSYDQSTGIYHRHRSNCFMNFGNVRIVGDYQTGQLHDMSRAYYTDAGAPLRAVRRTPHVWTRATRERVFMSQLQVEFMPGVGYQPPPGPLGLTMLAESGILIGDDGIGYISADNAYGPTGAITPADYLLAGFPLAALWSDRGNSGGDGFIVALEGAAMSAVWSISFTDKNGTPWTYTSSDVMPTDGMDGFIYWINPIIRPTGPEFTIGDTYAITVNVGAQSGGSSAFPAVIATNPQAMLRWSDDGGQTWSNEHWRSIGKTGQTKHRVMWRQLGRARDRVWEVVVSDPVRRDIVGATLYAEATAA